MDYNNFPFMMTIKRRISTYKIILLISLNLSSRYRKFCVETKSLLKLEKSEIISIKYKIL
jgi:hypothetical protein